MKIEYVNLKVGDFVKVFGNAKNTYEITSLNENKVGMRRVKDGLEHSMETLSVINMINSHLELNTHLETTGA